MFSKNILYTLYISTESFYGLRCFWLSTEEPRVYVAKKTVDEEDQSNRDKARAQVHVLVCFVCGISTKNFNSLIIYSTRHDTHTHTTEMRLNEHVQIVGQKVILVPYEAKHVER